MLIVRLLTLLIVGVSTAGPALAAHEDIVIRFTAEDGVELEGKLTIPARTEGGEGAAGAPVVFYLHGAGARTYDNPYGYIDENGARQVGFYLDYHAGELAERGVAFFRMSKRGCTAVSEAPWRRIDREIFSKATPEVLLADYEQGLEALRGRAEIDPERIVLLGSSEGTRLAPRLAAKSGAGIVGVVMTGYAADNARDTIVWQNTIGPWRGVQHMLPEARDGRLTREEYDAALAENASLARVLPFDVMDADADGALTAEDLTKTLAPRLDVILKAVEERNNDFLWSNLVNLSSEYLLEWWDDEPNHVALLEVDAPMAIFHGDLDGTCRVEGVHEAADALRAAGRANLTVHVYPDGDHDLGWTREAAVEGGPRAYMELFDYIRELVRPSP